MKQILIGFVALVTCSVVQGTTNGKGLLYPFTIDETLNCHRELKLSDGRTIIRPENPPRLPYGRRVMQGNNPRVFLPQDTSFRQPNLLGLNQDVQNKLLEFLAEDAGYSPILTSVSRPARDPPRACDLLPAFEGSAGQLKQHVEVVEEPIPLFELRTMSDTWNDTLNLNPVIGPGGIIATPAIRNDNTTNPALSEPGEQFRGFAFGAQIRPFINNHDAFCELWIAKCPLTPVWAELPPTFFPRYFAQGTCSGKNCSYPRGLFCEEDFTYSVYVTVLRWDCCYNAEGNQLRWDCGWRKVRIPILCDCTCACGPRFGMMSG